MSIVLKDYFVKEIQKNLYSDNSFLSDFRNMSQMSDKGKTLTYTDLSTPINIVVDGGAKTTDISVNDVSTTSKTVVAKHRKLDKPAGVAYFEQMGATVEIFDAAFKYLVDGYSNATANQVLSEIITDAVSDSVVITTTGAVGTANDLAGGAKNKLTVEDFIKAGSELMKQNATGEKIALMDAVQYSELLADPAILVNSNWGSNPVAKDGYINQIAGFKIRVRDIVSTTAIDDNRKVVCYIKNELTVFGDNPAVRVFEDDYNFQTNVNIQSHLLAFNSRNDGKNIVLIEQV